jgi:hypothetical protein
MHLNIQEQIWAQHIQLHQHKKFHFYAKISGHDLTHPTNRVAVHIITEEKIEKTSTVPFLVNRKESIGIICFLFECMRAEKA